VDRKARRRRFSDWTEAAAAAVISATDVAEFVEKMQIGDDERENDRENEN